MCNALPPYVQPRISKIEVKQRGRVRRARLYYLRELRGKAARIQQARYVPEKEEAAEGDSNGQQAAAAAAERGNRQSHCRSGLHDRPYPDGLDR